MRWVEGLGVNVFRQPANNTNGHTRDREGRLVSCEHGASRVTRTEVDGSITVLADGYQGKRLNSPNDVVVKSDGTVWFTDPTYGIDADYEGHKSESEIGACHVYRLDPATGTLEVVADDFARPNGIAFSPDEQTLYVADTGLTHDEDGPRHIRAFDVEDGRHLRNGRVFAVCEHGLFDGFRLDTEGNLWTSAGEGVNCYDPAGDLLGRIPIPRGRVQRHLRRPQAQPPVHHRHDLALRRLPQRQRRPAAVTRPPATWSRHSMAVAEAHLGWTPPRARLPTP